MREDSYFQFPLCLLAFGDDLDRRLDAIVDYCIVEAGQAVYDKMTLAERATAIDSFPPNNLPYGIKANIVRHRAVLVGMTTLRVSNGTVSVVLERHQACRAFIVDWQQRHGNDPYVRIKTEYLWEVKKGMGMTYREFSVLCAVYTIIGAKKIPVLITRSRILAAACGHKSPRSMATNGPLTVDQLRHTLNSLEAAGHFARCQASCRKVYFSNRMTRTEMRDKLFNWKTKRSYILRCERDADRTLRARIRSVNAANRRAGSSSSPRLCNRSTSVDQPLCAAQNGPALPPPRAHAVPTIIETPSIETCTTQTSLIETARARDEIEHSHPSGVDCEPQQPQHPASIEEVEAFANTCVKGATTFLPHFWQKVGLGEIKGDWRLAFVRFAMQELAKERRRVGRSAVADPAVPVTNSEAPEP